MGGKLGVMGLRAGEIFTERGLAFFDISDPNQKMLIPYDAIRSFVANDQVNPVADGSAATPETLARNSGSTQGSPLFPREGLVLTTRIELTVEQKRKMFRELFGINPKDVTAVLVNHDLLGQLMARTLNELGIETRTFYALKDGSFIVQKLNE